MAEQSPVGDDERRAPAMRLFGSKRGLSRPYYSRYALKLKAAGQFDGGSDEKLAKSAVLRYTIN